MSRKTKHAGETGEYEEDIRLLAAQSIKAYFADKSYFCGGPIPSKELNSEKSIKLVMRTQNDDPTFNFIHDECLAKLSRPKHLRSCTVPWTVKLLLGLINDMKKKQLPKDHQPGLILLDFKFCKGLSIPDDLISIK